MCIVADLSIRLRYLTTDATPKPIAPQLQSPVLIITDATFNDDFEALSALLVYRAFDRDDQPR